MAPAPASRWPWDASLLELATDALWIVFLIGATTAAYSLVENAERYFWFAADLVVLILLVPLRHDFLRLARANAIFLIWPLLACVSVLWSIAPGITLYHGLQLLMTVLVSFLLCIYASLGRIAQLVFLALAACAVLSVLNALVRPVLAISGFNEWLGVFPHKNTLGGMMGALIITGICLFLQGWWRLITAPMVALAFVLVFLSRSASAVAALAVTLMILPIALVYRRGGSLALALACDLVIIAAVLGYFYLETSNIDAVGAVLQGLGKDDTLSGRTGLWEFGMDAYENRPWLGHGYKAFWESTETAAPLLKMTFLVSFFHNNFLEVAVAFGHLGPIVLIVGLAYALFVTVRAYLVDPQPLRLWPLMYTVFLTALCFAEYPLFGNHGFHQLVFVAVVASSIESMARRKTGVDAPVRPTRA
jgi:O-antigen ligase